MTPEESYAEIQRRIPSTMSCTEALAEFISFYASTKIKKCPKPKEQDMLLFQFGGPYSWSKWFSINLTRQYTFKWLFGSYKGMKRLSMDIQFDPEIVSAGSGEKWFDGKDLTSFRDYVLGSEPVKEVTGLDHRGISFEYCDV